MRQHGPVLDNGRNNIGTQPCRDWLDVTSYQCMACTRE